MQQILVRATLALARRSTGAARVADASTAVERLEQAAAAWRALPLADGVEHVRIKALADIDAGLAEARLQAARPVARSRR